MRGMFMVALLALWPTTGSTATNKPKPDTWKQASEGTFKLVQFSFTRGLRDRRPVDNIRRVPCDGERVYAFVELFNKGPRRDVLMTWKRNGGSVARYRLAVGRSPSWKTWSFKRATGFTKGKWIVELADGEGKVLSRRCLVICSK